MDEAGGLRKERIEKKKGRWRGRIGRGWKGIGNKIKDRKHGDVKDKK